MRISLSTQLWFQEEVAEGTLALMQYLAMVVDKYGDVLGSSAISLPQVETSAFQQDLLHTGPCSRQWQYPDASSLGSRVGVGQRVCSLG